TLTRERRRQAVPGNKNSCRQVVAASEIRFGRTRLRFFGSRPHDRLGWGRQAEEKLRVARTCAIFGSTQSLPRFQQYAGRQAGPAVPLQLYADGDVRTART